MLSSIKKVFILLVIVTIITIVSVLLYSLNRTYFNKEGEIGNTSGNIYNGGLYCEQDSKIYFSNDSDDGSLYVMDSDCTNFKKLHDDKTAYINVDENYIYYVRVNNTRENNSGSILTFNNTGIYRTNQNGSNLKLITNNPGAYLTLNGNFLYLQRYNVQEGLHLYRYKIDASKEKLLIKDGVVPATIRDNKLYYTGYSNDHNINTMNLSSFTTDTEIEGNFAFPIFSGDYIYYLDMNDNYKIYRMNKNGSNRELLVDERCSTYNITNTGKYLYYQVDNGENNRICRMSLKTMEEEILIEGNHKQIHVTDNYVFFREYENTNTFILSADGSSKLGTFNPPDLSN